MNFEFAWWICTARHIMRSKRRAKRRPAASGEVDMARYNFVYAMTCLILLCVTIVVLWFYKMNCIGQLGFRLSFITAFLCQFDVMWCCGNGDCLMCLLVGYVERNTNIRLLEHNITKQIIKMKNSRLVGRTFMTNDSWYMMSRKNCRCQSWFNVIHHTFIKNKK